MIVICSVVIIFIFAPIAESNNVNHECYEMCPSQCHHFTKRTLPICEDGQCQCLSKGSYEITPLSNNIEDCRVADDCVAECILQGSDRAICSNGRCVCAWLDINKRVKRVKRHNCNDCQSKCKRRGFLHSKCGGASRSCHCYFHLSVIGYFKSREGTGCSVPQSMCDIVCSRAGFDKGSCDGQDCLCFNERNPLQTAITMEDNAFCGFIGSFCISSCARENAVKAICQNRRCQCLHIQKTPASVDQREIASPECPIPDALCHSLCRKRGLLYFECDTSEGCKCIHRNARFRISIDENSNCVYPDNSCNVMCRARGYRRSFCARDDCACIDSTNSHFVMADKEDDEDFESIPHQELQPKSLPNQDYYQDHLRYEGEEQPEHEDYEYVPQPPPPFYAHGSLDRLQYQEQQEHAPFAAPPMNYDEYSSEQDYPYMEAEPYQQQTQQFHTLSSDDDAQNLNADDADNQGENEPLSYTDPTSARFENPPNDEPVNGVVNDQDFGMPVPDESFIPEPELNSNPHTLNSPVFDRLQASFPIQKPVKYQNELLPKNNNDAILYDDRGRGKQNPDEEEEYDVLDEQLLRLIMPKILRQRYFNSYKDDPNFYSETENNVPRNLKSGYQQELYPAQQFRLENFNSKNPFQNQQLIPGHRIPMEYPVHPIQEFNQEPVPVIKAPVFYPPLENEQQVIPPLPNNDFSPDVNSHFQYNNLLSSSSSISQNAFQPQNYSVAQYNNYGPIPYDVPLEQPIPPKQGPLPLGDISGFRASAQKNDQFNALPYDYGTTQPVLPYNGEQIVPNPAELQNFYNQNYAQFKSLPFANKFRKTIADMARHNNQMMNRVFNIPTFNEFFNRIMPSINLGMQFGDFQRQFGLPASRRKGRARGHKRKGFHNPRKYHSPSPYLASPDAGARHDDEEAAPETSQASASPVEPVQSGVTLVPFKRPHGNSQIPVLEESVPSKTESATPGITLVPFPKGKRPGTSSTGSGKSGVSFVPFSKPKNPSSTPYSAISNIRVSEGQSPGSPGGSGITHVPFAKGKSQQNAPSPSGITHIPFSKSKGASNTGNGKPGISFGPVSKTQGLPSTGTDSPGISFVPVRKGPVSNGGGQPGISYIPATKARGSTNNSPPNIPASKSNIVVPQPIPNAVPAINQNNADQADTGKLNIRDSPIGRSEIAFVPYVKATNLFEMPPNALPDIKKPLPEEDSDSSTAVVAMPEDQNHIPRKEPQPDQGGTPSVPSQNPPAPVPTETKVQGAHNAKPGISLIPFGKKTAGANNVEVQSQNPPAPVPTETKMQGAQNAQPGISLIPFGKKSTAANNVKIQEDSTKNSGISFIPFKKKNSGQSENQDKTENKDSAKIPETMSADFPIFNKREQFLPDQHAPTVHTMSFSPYKRPSYHSNQQLQYEPSQSFKQPLDYEQPPYSLKQPLEYKEPSPSFKQQGQYERPSYPSNQQLQFEPSQSFKQPLDYEQPPYSLKQPLDYNEPSPSFKQQGQYEIPSYPSNQQLQFEPSQSFNQPLEYEQPSYSLTQSLEYKEPSQSYKQPLDYGRPSYPLSQPLDYEEPSNSYKQQLEYERPSYPLKPPLENEEQLQSYKQQLNYEKPSYPLNQPFDYEEQSQSLKQPLIYERPSYPLNQQLGYAASQSFKQPLNYERPSYPLNQPLENEEQSQSYKQPLNYERPSYPLNQQLGYEPSQSFKQQLEYERPSYPVKQPLDYEEPSQSFKQLEYERPLYPVKQQFDYEPSSYPVKQQSEYRQPSYPLNQQFEYEQPSYPLNQQLGYEPSQSFKQQFDYEIPSYPLNQQLGYEPSQSFKQQFDYEIPSYPLNQQLGYEPSQSFNQQLDYEIPPYPVKQQFEYERPSYPVKQQFKYKQTAYPLSAPSESKQKPQPQTPAKKFVTGKNSDKQDKKENGETSNEMASHKQETKTEKTVTSYKSESSDTKTDSKISPDNNSHDPEPQPKNVAVSDDKSPPPNPIPPKDSNQIVYVSMKTSSKQESNSPNFYWPKGAVPVKAKEVQIKGHTQDNDKIINFMNKVLVDRPDEDDDDDDEPDDPQDPENVVYLDKRKPNNNKNSKQPMPPAKAKTNNVVNNNNNNMMKWQDFVPFKMPRFEDIFPMNISDFMPKFEPIKFPTFEMPRFDDFNPMAYVNNFFAGNQANQNNPQSQAKFRRKRKTFRLNFAPRKKHTRKSNDEIFMSDRKGGSRVYSLRRKP